MEVKNVAVCLGGLRSVTTEDIERSRFGEMLDRGVCLTREEFDTALSVFSKHERDGFWAMGFMPEGSDQARCFVKIENERIPTRVKSEKLLRREAELAQGIVRTPLEIAQDLPAGSEAAMNAAISLNKPGCSFSTALQALKDGQRVCRSGWNGKGMWLLLVNAENYDVFNLPEASRRLPWIGMKTADNGFVPWLASQTDLLANDWMIIP